jgi:hypothetical protein
VLASAGGGGAALGQRRGQAGVEAAPLGHRRHLVDRRGHDRHRVAVRCDQAGGVQRVDRLAQAVGSQFGRRPQQLVVEVGAGAQRPEHGAGGGRQLVHLGAKGGHQ